MGNLKEGDQVIVTMVLYVGIPSIGIPSKYSTTAKDLMSSVHKVVQVDRSGAPFPYKIEVGKSTFWVEGVPYSSLIRELM